MNQVILSGKLNYIDESNPKRLVFELLVDNEPFAIDVTEKTRGIIKTIPLGTQIKITGHLVIDHSVGYFVNVVADNIELTKL